MRPAQRVRNVWAWLPVFRAVAEAGHLPTAAHDVGIVPSALSRTIKQVEESLGAQLFDRKAKALALNSSGRILLGAVREAMRLIDDALGTVTGDELRGPVTTVSPADLLPGIITPAGAAVIRDHPELTFIARVAPPAEMGELLVTGEADAALALAPLPSHPEIHCVEIASWTRGVYRGGERATTRPFRCVRVGLPAAAVDDGWPASVERHVAAWAPDERTALELCAASHDLVTTATDVGVRSSRLAREMSRLDAPLIENRTLYLAHRRAVGRHLRTEAIVAAILATAHAL